MRDIARPALAEVLAAITDRPVGHWRAELASPAFVRVEPISSRDVRWIVRVDPFRATTQTRRATLRSTEPVYEPRRVGNTLTRVEIAPAHTITPAEAVEALATARLWPWEPGDEEEPRWWCRRCGDPVVKTSDIPREASAAIQRAILGEFDAVTDRALRLSSSEVFFRVMDIAERAACVDCGGTPHGGSPGIKTPAFLGDVVAVASLGAPQLARYVHLAGEIARAAGCAGASVVWRPMTREAIEEMRKAVSWGVAPSTIVEASIQSDWYASDPRVASSAWGGWRPGVVSPEINEVMPMLRDLHAGGVRLVGLDASRIVLAVESIGGDRG